MYLRLGLYERGGRQVSAKNLSDWYLDSAKLEAEAYHDAQHQTHDEKFECSESLHRPRGPIKDKDYEHINYGNGAASNKGHLEKDVESDGGTNDLRPSAEEANRPVRIIPPQCQSQ